MCTRSSHVDSIVESTKWSVVRSHYGLVVRTCNVRECTLLYYGNTQKGAQDDGCQEYAVRVALVRVAIIFNAGYNHHDHEDMPLGHILGRKDSLVKRG